MKHIWKWIVALVLLSGIALLSVLYAKEVQYTQRLEATNERQGVIIDSLLNRKMQCLDVELWVTDKSHNVIHGRYNKGTITMPQERRYVLVIDSASTWLRYDETK